ncbi:MAG: type II toxin-antitoxin system HicB family antitoxin [Bacteroidetes bacterium]|nr:type II toxin-antitoxin system HicB family antitoxin [Bacteroidota bacterium]
MKLTAIIEQSEDGWYVGQIEEIPSAISQGKTIEELKANLIEALELIMEANREETEKDYQGRDVIREQLVLV